MDNLLDIAEKINTKEDFISFLKSLINDYQINKHEWMNDRIDTYFEAMSAYLNDTSDDSISSIRNRPTWKMIAQLMIAASIYE